MPPPRIAIIGAGITGLSCAHHLRTAIPTPDITFFEKSRHVGGRLATKTNFLSTPIDHGAPHFSLNNPFAKSFVTSLVPDLRQLPSNAFVNPSGETIPQQHAQYYCPSGNNVLAQTLSTSFRIRYHHHVVSVRPDATVRFNTADGNPTVESFDLAVVTAPLPQAAALFNDPGPDSHIPCLTALLAYNRDQLPNHPILSTSAGRPPYAIVAEDVCVYVDSFKRRARGGMVMLVTQAGEDFSRRYLEAPEQEWLELLTRRTEELWKLPQEARLDAFPKRWRYARIRSGTGVDQGKAIVATEGTGVEECLVGGKQTAEKVCQALGLSIKDKGPDE